MIKQIILMINIIIANKLNCVSTDTKAWIIYPNRTISIDNKSNFTHSARVLNDIQSENIVNSFYQQYGNNSENSITKYNQSDELNLSNYYYSNNYTNLDSDYSATTVAPSEYWSYNRPVHLENFHQSYFPQDTYGIRNLTMSSNYYPHNYNKQNYPYDQSIDQRLDYGQPELMKAITTVRASVLSFVQRFRDFIRYFWSFFSTDNTITGRAKKNKFKIKKKYRKFLLPLLMAYKLKFFTLIPFLIGGLVLLAGSTGMAGFFFALFAAVISLKASGGH